MAPTLKARPTTYKGIEMRSRLEAGFAQWLDEWGCDWEYEPRAFASERGQYLPDFKVSNVLVGYRRADLYIEVKPNLANDLDAWTDARLSEADVIHESEPEAIFVVAVKDVGRQVDYATAFVATPANLGNLWVACWSHSGDGNLGLVIPVSANSGPWPDGYWAAR